MFRSSLPTVGGISLNVLLEFYKHLTQDHFNSDRFYDMRHLLIALLFVGTLLGNVAQAESANAMAVRIIESQPSAGYNPLNTSKEEMARAYAYNSKMQLNALMAKDKSISEELRICYAIHLLDSALGIQKVLRSGTKLLPKEEEMVKQRLILGARLEELAKAEQNAAGQSATAE
jgi:hypothetical protein